MLSAFQRVWLTSYKLNFLRTKLAQLFSPCDHTKAIFVFGCQRSGTTMIGKVIGFSPLVTAYGEGDEPYFYQDGHPDYLRLFDWNTVKKLLLKEKSQFTLLKPLYDSQVAGELINFFPGSKAVWLYRHYLDAVDSHIKNYKNDHDGIIYTKELFDREETIWKNEGLPPDMIKVLDQFKGRQINSATGYALFWLARNSLYAQVQHNPDVLLVRYESLIADPFAEFSKIFSFLGVPFKQKYVTIIHSRAVKKPIDFVIDAEVQQLCDTMYDNLRRMTP